MSHTNRKGEPPSLRPRRRDRCFELNGRWYVTTRGAVYVGPFPTRTAADAAAKQLIKLLADVDDPNVAGAFVREFTRRAVRNERTNPDVERNPTRS
jgi:Domain of unknown function (DUF6316)